MSIGDHEVGSLMMKLGSGGGGGGGGGIKSVIIGVHLTIHLMDPN